MRSLLCLMVVLPLSTGLLGCQTLPPIDWSQVEQATSFAQEKLPAVVAWLEDSGWLEAQDTENPSLRGLFLNITIRIATQYLVAEGRLPTWDEVKEEVGAYLNYLWSQPEGVEDEYDGLPR